jgi:hypothetical protein
MSTRGIIGAILCISCVGCFDPGPPKYVVEVDCGTEVALYVGDSVQCTATAFENTTNGRVRTEPQPLVTWEGTAAIAKVNSNGLVRVTSTGELAIVAHTRRASGIARMLARNRLPRENWYRHLPNVPDGLAIDAKGNAIIVDNSRDDPKLNSNQLYWYSYGSDGKERFSGTPTDDGLNWNTSVAWTSSNEFVVAGSRRENSQRHAVLTQLDSTGQRRWQTILALSSKDEWVAVAPFSNGAVGVLGTTEGTNGADLLVAKYSPEGTLMWSKNIGGAGVEKASAVVITASSEVCFAGSTRSTFEDIVATSERVFVGCLDSNGNKKWFKSFGPSSGSEAKAMSVDSAQNLFIGGETLGQFSSPSQGKRDVFAMKLDSNGVTQWTKQFGTSADDEMRALAISPKTGNTSIVAWAPLGFPEGTADKLMHIEVLADASATEVTGLALGEPKAAGFDSSGNALIVGVTLSTRQGFAFSLAPKSP